MTRSLLAGLAAVLAAGSASAHDPWVQTNTNLVRTGDAVHIDLMLGNHGNDHRDFKLASKFSPEMARIARSGRPGRQAVRPQARPGGPRVRPEGGVPLGQVHDRQAGPLRRGPDLRPGGEPRQAGAGRAECQDLLRGEPVARQGRPGPPRVRQAPRAPCSSPRSARAATSDSIRSPTDCRSGRPTARCRTPDGAGRPTKGGTEMRCVVILIAVAWAGTTPAAGGDKPRTTTFSKGDLGKVPAGWTAGHTNKGGKGSWKVVGRPDRPGEDRVRPGPDGRESQPGVQPVRGRRPQPQGRGGVGGVQGERRGKGPGRRRRVAVRRTPTTTTSPGSTRWRTTTGCTRSSPASASSWRPRRSSRPRPASGTR